MPHPLITSSNQISYQRNSAYSKFQLHHDILWQIFLWNANVFTSSNGLETTRRCSQVCRAWRSILLHSSSIWGRLIDLESFSRTSILWRKEVVRRSGNSRLWIGGPLSYATQAFLYSLLDTQLHRIEHIEIALRDTKIDDYVWLTFLRPAPRLRSCSINGLHPSTNFNTLFYTSTKPLFANEAPLLRDFSAQGLSFNLSAPWVKHLRQLDITSRFRIVDILKCLKSMPLLESLGISWTRQHLPFIGPSTSDESVHVILPNLIELRLILPEFYICEEFLQHIQPAKDCSMLCVSNAGPDSYVEMDTPSAHFSSHIQRYLRACAHSFIRLQLDILENIFQVMCFAGNSDRKFQFKVSCPKVSTQGLIHSLTALVSTCDFSPVDELVLNLRPQPTSFVEVCAPLLSSLTALRTLSLSERSLRTILALHEIGVMPFPHLRTLEIRSVERHSGRNWESPLLEYLYQRQDSGRIVRNLVFSMSLVQYGYDVSTLATLDGLRLYYRNLWGEIEYVGRSEYTHVRPG